MGLVVVGGGKLGTELVVLLQCMERELRERLFLLPLVARVSTQE